MKIQPPTLGLKTAVCMVIGTVIGSGIFLTPSNVVAAVPFSFWPLGIWLVAGLLSLLGCMIFSELGARFPKSGGQYIYLFESFGPLVAYLYGWTLIAVIQSGAIAAEASIFAQFTNGFLGNSPANLKLFGAAVIVAFTGLNILGLKKATDVLDFLTFLKIAALLLIPVTVLFFFHASAQSMPLLPVLTNTPALSVGGFGVGLIAAFWAYDGWNSLGYIAGDVKNPKRNIPLATIGGMGFVIFLYLAVNWAFQRVLTPSEISQSTNLATDVLTRAFGKGGGVAIALAVIITTLGTTNAFIIAGSRIIFAVAQKGGLPRFLANTSEGNQVPVNAFLVQMIWSLVLLFSGRFDQLFTCVISVSFIFYGLTAFGLLRLRQRSAPPAINHFKVPRWIPIFYTLFCLGFTTNTFLKRPQESLVGLILTLLGVPAYYFFRWWNQVRKEEHVF